MSFGIEILTPDGLVNATQTRAARLHSKETFLKWDEDSHRV